MKILPRSTWTSTPEGFSRRLVPARVQWVALHYPGTAAAIGAVSVERAAELLRGYRNYHRSGRGWPDIGYCYGVDQAGRVYSLAGEKVAAHSASEGYREANHEGIGVLLLIGNTEQPTDALIDSTNALIQHLRTTAGYSGIRKVYGHRQVPGASTSCPGDRVIELLRTGRIGLDRAPAATTPAPTPAPVTPDQRTYSTLRVDGIRGRLTLTAWQVLLKYIAVPRRYTGRIDGVYGPMSNKAEQTWLAGLGYYKGRIDGVRGPVHKKSLQRFLRKKGLYGGLIDGVEGPMTVKAEQRYLNDQRKYL